MRPVTVTEFERRLVCVEGQTRCQGTAAFAVNSCN